MSLLTVHPKNISKLIPLLMMATALIMSTSTFADTMLKKINPSQVHSQKNLPSLQGVLNQTKNNSSPHRASNSFSNGKPKDSHITAHCWTVAECNDMISDCISVGGSFHSGIRDHKTGATSEGSCTL